MRIATQNTLSPEGGFNALHDAIRVKQAWGEVTLPFGVLSAGRMGALVSWGTGFFVNNGDCLDCDFGDSGDRIALTVPILNHYVTAMYELSASGPYVVPAAQPIDLERRAQVNTAALAIARLDSVEAQRRKLRAGRTLLNYGILASYRRQDLDAPAWTQPGGLVRSYAAGDFVARDLQSFAGDVWLMVHAGGFRAELEFGTVLARIGDATNTPGVSLLAPVTATQLGGVASLSYGFSWPIHLRVEVGMASGDDAPGFGINGSVLLPKKGDLDGGQIHPPSDMTIDNFRFSPDYHVDLILWRRIVGTVTDGVYLRPSVRLGPFGSVHHNVSFEAAFIESSAIDGDDPARPSDAPGRGGRSVDALSLRAGIRGRHTVRRVRPGCRLPQPRLEPRAAAGASARGRAGVSSLGAENERSHKISGVEIARLHNEDRAASVHNGRARRRRLLRRQRAQAATTMPPTARRPISAPCASATTTARSIATSSPSRSA